MDEAVQRLTIRPIADNPKPKIRNLVSQERNSMNRNIQALVAVERTRVTHYEIGVFVSGAGRSGKDGRIRIIKNSRALLRLHTPFDQLLIPEMIGNDDMVGGRTGK